MRLTRARGFLILISVSFLFGAPGPSCASTSDGSALRAIYRIPLAPGTDVRPLLKLGLDVAGIGPGGSLDVIVNEAELSEIRALGFAPLAVAVPTRGPLSAAQSPLMKPGLGLYHTVAEAHTEMAAYVAAHPAIALLDTIGFSIEGRPIEAIKISDNVDSQEAEPEALIVGCHHARELMSVEIPLYLMRRLLDGYGVDPLVTSLVDGRQIWIVPIENPDGHVYVEQHSGGQSDTWWRKNRRPNPDGTFGVDLNRNYSYLWGYDDIGSSPTPSSEVYRGVAPFSEPESAALRDLVAAHAFGISCSFHSYGDLVLYPWGYTAADTPENSVFRALGDSISAQNGYLAGNVKSGTIYQTNGDLDDWVYGDTAIKPRLFGFTFEVNTADEGGFAPSETLIGPTCDLSWGPLLTLLRYADEPRRILPPARAGRPSASYAVGTGYTLRWSYPAPDPLNLAVRHDVRRIDSLAVVADDAEAGAADWDTTLFAVSTARSASGTHSYASGSGDNRTSVLTGHIPVDALYGDSVVVNAYWDLEPNHDYWYVEASADGGATWVRLPGDHTTSFNPYGYNLGSGITGSSGGIFRRSAFTLASVASRDVLLRIRCITDAVTHGEGLYLDDIRPVVHESGISVTDTGSPDTSTVLPGLPWAVTYFQVRGVDGENEVGSWSPRLLLATATGVADGGEPVPGPDRIGPVSPNPFHPTLSVSFSIGRGTPGVYRIDVYDTSGRGVARLAEGWDGGTGRLGTVRWDGRDASGAPAASGIYLVRLSTARGVWSAKATLMR